MREPGAHKIPTKNLASGLKTLASNIASKKLAPKSSIAAGRRREATSALLLHRC